MMKLKNGPGHLLRLFVFGRDIDFLKKLTLMFAFNIASQN